MKRKKTKNILYTNVDNKVRASRKKQKNNNNNNQKTKKFESVNAGVVHTRV